MADVRDLEQDEQEEPVTIDLNKQRERLLSMREQLELDLSRNAERLREDGDDLDPNRGGVSNHIADDGNETFEQEKLIALRLSTERELDRVNTALERLDEGTYGTCANCGKPIGAARLDALPWAIYDIDCQQLDDQGRL